MISIVIPAYNESQEVIESTITRCISIMKNRYKKFEIIIVDDGSVDKVLPPRSIANLRVLRHPHNVGYGQSLKDGIRLATFDTIVITDADGTYPIESIPTLIADYENGFDMVVGARTGKHYDESIGKKFLRIILKGLVEYTAGRKIPDINSGLRVFSKKRIQPFYKYLCNTFSFTTSLTLAYMMNGYYVKYHKIKYSERNGKSKVKIFRDSLRTLQFVIEAMLFYNPMKVFFAIILTLTTITLLCFIAYISTNKSSLLQATFYTFVSTIMMLGFSLVSIQLKQLLQNPSTESNSDNEQ